MRKGYWGWVIHLIFISIALVANTYTCLCARNITKVTCSKKERVALLKFKHSVVDEYGVLSSWVGNDCCEWERVHCDGVTGYVDSLYLGGRDQGNDDDYLDILVGNEVSSSLGELRHLKYLDLSWNNFQRSRMPDFIGSLKQLSYLDLSYSFFSGNIPHPIGNLSNLKVLKLAFNYLNSSIPNSLGSCRSLQVLDLFGNLLTGTIPTFRGKLTFLDLSGNNLSGSIPESLGSCRSLQVLDLSENQLTGPIPTFLGKFTRIHLSYNRLNGSIPMSVGKLVSLQEFSVSSNLLTGKIPVSIGQLTKLRYLNVSSNSLEGIVFEDHFAKLSMLGTLDTSSNSKLSFNISREWMPPFLQLRHIDLSFCKIVDGFPHWLNGQRKLRRLVLSNTTISGPLPTWLGKLPVMGVLDLSHNKLNGPLTNLPHKGTANSFFGENILLLQNNLFNESIPRSLCTMTRLVVLNLSKNKLIGQIPNCLGDLQRLYVMSFSSNALSGVIPNSLGNCSSLEWLNLNDNKFIGELPRGLGNLAFLQVLDVGDNEFSGIIPEWIGEQLGRLGAFRLHKNNFSGRIPPSLCKLSLLQILDVAHNNLIGPIPHCLRGLASMVTYTRSSFFTSDQDDSLTQVLKGVALEYTKTLRFVINMDLSSNKFVGEISKEITALSALIGLNLSNNHLSGSIPNNIGNMKALNSLDLSGNKLTGIIPTSIGNLNFLSHLNLSHNNLSGQIPTGNQLQTLNDPSMYAGNKDLCGAPLPTNCSYNKDPTITPKNKYQTTDEPKKVLFYADVICGFVTGFWGFIGVLVFKKQWRHKFFMFVESTIDKIYVAIIVRVTRMKRGREAP